MPTITLGTIKQRVLDRLEGNTAEFADAQLTLVVNECLRWLNLLIGFNQATVAVAGNSVAGQLEYAIPAGIIFPMRVDFNQRELSYLSTTRLARKYRGWSTDTTTYCGPVEDWSLIGSRKFILHPIDAAGGATLDVTGVAAITPLVNTGDVAALDDQWIDVIIDRAIPRLLLKEGGKPFADASIVRNQLVTKLRPAVLWQEMEWPAYWVAKTPDSGDGKGAGQ